MVGACRGRVRILVFSPITTYLGVSITSNECGVVLDPTGRVAANLSNARLARNRPPHPFALEIEAGTTRNETHEIFGGAARVNSCDRRGLSLERSRTPRIGCLSGLRFTSANSTACTGWQSVLCTLQLLSRQTPSRATGPFPRAHRCDSDNTCGCQRVSADGPSRRRALCEHDHCRRCL